MHVKFAADSDCFVKVSMLKNVIVAPTYYVNTNIYSLIRVLCTDMLLVANVVFTGCYQRSSSTQSMTSLYGSMS